MAFRERTIVPFHHNSEGASCLAKKLICAASARLRCARLIRQGRVPSGNIPPPSKFCSHASQSSGRCAIRRAAPGLPTRGDGSSLRNLSPPSKPPLHFASLRLPRGASRGVVTAGRGAAPEVPADKRGPRQNWQALAPPADTHPASGVLTRGRLALEKPGQLFRASF